MSESRYSAVLNSGATSTVKSWMNAYIKSSDDKNKAKFFRDSTEIYRFGDEKL